MRRILSGLLAAVLALGLALAQPVEAKVYKMTPEERAAALKEKKQGRKKAKKSGKPAPGDGQGGWVEVKPSGSVAKKNRRAKVDELAKAAEDKARKKNQARKAAAGTTQKTSAKKQPEKQLGQKAAGKPDKKPSEKPSKKIDKKADKSVEPAPAQAGKPQAQGRPGRKTATHGDRPVDSAFTGERKVSASSTEVRRAVPAAVPASAPAPATAAAPRRDEAAGSHAGRPGQGTVPVASQAASQAAPQAPAQNPTQNPALNQSQAPHIRQQVQPGPLDASTPVGTDRSAGEGRF